MSEEAPELNKHSLRAYTPAETDATPTGPALASSGSDTSKRQPHVTYLCYGCGRLHQKQDLRNKVTRQNGKLYAGSNEIPPFLPLLQQLLTCDVLAEDARICDASKNFLIALGKGAEQEKTIEAGLGPSSATRSSTARSWIPSPMRRLKAVLRKGPTTYSCLRVEGAGVSKRRKHLVAAVSAAVAEAEAAAANAGLAAVLAATNDANDAITAATTTTFPPDAAVHGALPAGAASTSSFPPNVHAAEGKEKELLADILKKVGLHGIYENILVVDGELPWDKKTRPSRQHFLTHFHEIQLPAAVFQIVEINGKKFYRPRLAVRDDVCSDDDAKGLADGWSYLLHSTPKLSPIAIPGSSREHFPETKIDPEFRPPTEFHNKHPKLLPRMYGIGFSMKQGNHQCIAANILLGATTKNAKPRVNQLAILTLLGQAVKATILDKYFSGGLKLLASAKEAVMLHKLCFTGAAVAINGWAPYTHLDGDVTGWAFLNFFKTGKLDGVVGGEFLFPSYGLYFRLKTRCTVLYLNTTEVPHCATESFAATGRIIGSSWFVNADNCSAAEILRKAGKLTAEERLRLGLSTTVDDMDDKTRAAPEMVALNALIDGAAKRKEMSSVEVAMN